MEKISLKTGTRMWHTLSGGKLFQPASWTWWIYTLDVVTLYTVSCGVEYHSSGFGILCFVSTQSKHNFSLDMYMYHMYVSVIIMVNPPNISVFVIEDMWPLNNMYSVGSLFNFKKTIYISVEDAFVLSMWWNNCLFVCIIFLVIAKKLTMLGHVTLGLKKKLLWIFNTKVKL